MFNYYEPGRWNSPENLVTGVVVSYNTKELLQTAIDSIRKFHPTMKIIIVDNSDKKNPCYSYVDFLSSETIKVIHTGKNLGHGSGIIEGIKHVETPYMLLFDSDIVMRKTCVQDMIDMIAPDTYGVGWIQINDIGGHLYETRKNMTPYGSMRYLHPFFCLIQLSEYKKYPPFIQHGSPAVNTMYAIHKEGSSIQKVKSLDNIFEKYITHDFEGTRKICGIGGGTWDNADGDLDAKNGKAHSPLNGITCVTCTGDRSLAFTLCAIWMKDQTVQPDQWLIVDDGKIPMGSLGAVVIPQNCEYIRREPTTKDPLHTMTINLQLALSKATGDKIIIIEDDEYYSPKYVEEMSKKLDEYDLVGIGKSKYYNMQGFKYYQHNGVAFADHASLAQTAFNKSLIPSILKKMNGDQFIDVRIWQGLRGNSNIFVDDKQSLYVGIKGMPGRKGIGSGHNINMEGYKDDKNKAVLKEWITNDKHRELYLNLKSQPNERRILVGTYKAIKNGGYIPANCPYKSSVLGRINPGTIFEWDGPVGLWMAPVDAPEVKMVPIEDLPIYVKAKEISESKGLPSLDKTPLDSKPIKSMPKLKGKK
jgi:GT2 family glycosyltransferase